MTYAEKINILLVDDRPENLLAIEAVIDEDEYHLVKASSGEEALKALLKDKFALILLDVQMPGMDGFSTAKIIKAREKTKNIPILFITANNMETEHIFMGYSVGAIDYILKPVDPLVLKAKVEGFVDIYKMKQQLVQQAAMLTERTKELEQTNHHLSEMTAKLRVSETLANVISETSKDAMFIFDEKGSIMKANPSCERELQYQPTELVGRNIRNLFTEREASIYIENLFKRLEVYGSLQDDIRSQELYVTRKDGTSFLSEIHIGLTFIQDKGIIACTIRNIALKKKNEVLIKHMAYHDFLTELPNRRAYNKTLITYLKRAKNLNQPLGVMFLDMDRFKYINDSLGHSIGDRALQEVANRLSSIVRDHDFVARVGGDEFTIILPNTDRETALESAEYILEAFQNPLNVNNYELFITTSIGLSIFPYDGVDFEELNKHADIALYQAKEQGKNNYHVFHTGMNMQTYRSFIMQNDLRKAIEKDEFKLVYQPRINVVTGKIESAEALLRWNHPSWGVVNPSEFIPLAEQTGLIVQIGDWVLRAACEQMQRWNVIGHTPIRIAINFSANQFLQKDLIVNIKQVLTETGVNPNQLEIELTESALLENEEFITNTLKRLREIGISISIDDFGTGYSSLQYLSRLPVNILKIDQAFIQGITEQPSVEKSITKMIITLAKSLDLSIIAEGVETEEQFHFLRLQESDEVQGYLFSPPTDHKTFEKMIAQPDFNAISERLELKIEYQEKSDEPEEKENLISEALGQLKKKYQLSPRELEVFELIVDGLTNKEISQNLYISEHTVKNHISNIFHKTSVTDRSQAMAMVYQYVVNQQGGIADIR